MRKRQWGGVAEDLEDYPNALRHFQAALGLAQQLHQNEVYEELHCASVFWRLGRYKDFTKQIKALHANAIRQSGTEADVQVLLAASELSQGLNRDALERAGKAISHFPSMPPSEIAEFERIKALSEAREGQSNNALRDAALLLAVSEKEHSEALIAKAHLAQAEVLQRSHEFDQAKIAARLANSFFAAKKDEESQWLSFLIQAQADHSIGDEPASKAEAKKALDILSELEQSWTSPVFRVYIARHDYLEAKQQLEKLAQ